MADDRTTDDEADCGHHSWAGLMSLLDEHWPDDIFPTRYEDDPKRGAGPRIVSLMRWVDEQWAAIERVRRIHEPVKPVWADAAKKPEMRCCETCYDETASDEDNTWPCHTIRALGGGA